MRLWWAFLRRDLQVAASYRSATALAAVGGLVTLAVLYYLAKVVGEPPLLRHAYGSDYFSFALLGLSAASALRSLQTSFARQVRQAQFDGSLEVLLASPHSTFRVVGLMAAYPLALALVRAVGLLLAGAIFFGARFHLNLWGFLGSLALGLAAFAALGLLSAAFVLTAKRGDPFSYLLDATNYLFAGILYPVEVLPKSLQRLSNFLPATHALRALRASALQAVPPAQLLSEWALLALFALALWLLAALALGLARRHIERCGSLPDS